MGFGGIIFVAILALLGLYLFPVLVRERSSRLDSRSGDRTSAAVRVLHRPVAQRPSRRVVLTVDRPLVSDDLPARPTRDLAVALLREARQVRLGVRVRAAAAALGVLAVLVTGVGAVAGAFGGWVVAVAGGWLAGVLVVGAVAAGVRRRAAAPTARVASLPPRAYRVATEVFDDRAGRSGAPEPAAASRPTVAVEPVEVERSSIAEVAPRADATWTPVEVPGPVYASKPASHRPPALPWSLPPAALQDESSVPAQAAAPAQGPAAQGPAVVSVTASQDVDREADGAFEQERHSAAG